ncbi:hypothetical protein [Streptomyces montanisoli]|uniref:Uncharacterized protein n=1 Tax=Streptomyces montanisoli TaxID=2798581 RepID=A0A940RVW3_9ACTN|nr:hypothetical protein [Streptomyces montanisoli]MBP0458661.1 hypothetical protein [Streptomyces montanisoli]
MPFVRLAADGLSKFVARFGKFEDAVVTGIQLHLPRRLTVDRLATLDIQAVDASSSNEWRLVRLAVGGVYEYQFACSKQQSYSVLSDGLKLDCASERCVLDLDPGPDEWSPEQVGEGGEYSKQYVIGTWLQYEVLDGPFV